MPTLYLRPSADISVGHKLSSGTSGYLLIDDISCDNDSTYLYSDPSPDANTTITAESSFLFSGTIPGDAHKITSARINCSLYSSNNCSNEYVSFGISVNGTQIASVYLDSNTITNSLVTGFYNTYPTTVTNEIEIVNAFNDYISGKVSDKPEISITIRSGYTGSSKGEGYLRISHVCLELDYDMDIHRKVNGVWKNTTTAYKKVNGLWTIFTESRRAISTGLVQFGHEQIIMPSVDYTCTESGLTLGYKCSICGEIIRGQEIIPAAHRPVKDAAVAATCIATGLTEGSHCSMCNEVLVVQQTTPATGIHIDENGDNLCDVCSATLCSDNNHVSVVDAAVTATCTTTGLTEGSHCSACGKVLVAQQVVPVIAHSYILTDTTEECSVCGYVLRRFTVSKHGTTELSVARRDLAATSVGDYALFGGGALGMNTNSAVTACVDAYNTSLTRSAANNLSTPVRELAATTATRAVFAGGSASDGNGSAVVTAYDSSLTVTNPESLTYPVMEPAAANYQSVYAFFAGGVTDGGNFTDQVNIYMQGNTKRTSTLNTARTLHAGTFGASVTMFAGGIDNNFSYLSSCEYYDGLLSHKTAPDLSVARAALSGGTCGGSNATSKYAVFAGGSNDSGDLNTVDVYTKSSTRINATELSLSRSNITATSVGDCVVFSGGYYGNGSYSHVVDVYNSSLTRTNPTSLSIARYYIAAASVGNYALFGGGHNHNSLFNTVDVYVYG